MPDNFPQDLCSTKIEYIAHTLGEAFLLLKHFFLMSETQIWDTNITDVDLLI